MDIMDILADATPHRRCESNWRCSLVAPAKDAVDARGDALLSAPDVERVLDVMAMHCPGGAVNGYDSEWSHDVCPAIAAHPNVPDVFVSRYRDAVKDRAAYMVSYDLRTVGNLVVNPSVNPEDALTLITPLHARGAYGQDMATVYLSRGDITAGQAVRLCAAFPGLARVIYPAVEAQTYRPSWLTSANAAEFQSGLLLILAVA